MVFSLFRKESKTQSSYKKNSKTYFGKSNLNKNVSYILLNNRVAPLGIAVRN